LIFAIGLKVEARVRAKLRAILGCFSEQSMLDVSVDLRTDFTDA